MIRGSRVGWRRAWGLCWRAQEPAGGVVQSSHGGAKEGHVPPGQRLRGGERSGGEVAGGNA